VTEWYRAGRRGLASGGNVDLSLFSLDDYEHVQITSKLIVAQAYAYGCDRVVYVVKPATEVTVIDAQTGHAICRVATIDGIAQMDADLPPEKLWESVAKCVWWDGSPMYTDEAYTVPPPGFPESGLAGHLGERFATQQYLLPGQLKMLLENHSQQLPSDCPPRTWLVG
jgi:hypothetical protein